MAQNGPAQKKPLPQVVLELETPLLSLHLQSEPI
jgi:hypothetical protein